MKKLAFLLAMVLGTINMYAQDYDLEGLAKALNEYYIDGGFHCGLAVAVKGNYCGYINKKGQLVIPFNYISAEEFRDNQAKVLKEGSEEYFFIDKNGNKIASPSVIASFCVEKDGTISNVEIVKSVHPLLDNETIRLLKTMPKWIPGTQDGIPVRAKFSVPLTYNFTEELN